MSDTADDRLLSIGEFVAVCQLSVKMLRHYHTIGLLEPARVDESSGYRYYRFAQSIDAQAILELRRLEVPLAEVAAIVGADSEQVHALLEAQRDRLRAELTTAENRLAHIERLLEREPFMAYEITERTIAAQRVVSTRVSGPNTPEANQQLLISGLERVWEAVASAGATESDLTGPPVVVVHHGDEARFEQELCIPVDAITPDGFTVRDLEPVRAAVARHVGDRPNVREVMEWANQRGHRVGVPFRVMIVAAPPYFGEGDTMVCDIVVPYLDDTP